MGLVFLEIFRLSQSHCKVVWWIRNPNPNLIAEILMTHTTRLVLAKMKNNKANKRTRLPLASSHPRLIPIWNPHVIRGQSCRPISTINQYDQ